MGLRLGEFVVVQSFVDKSLEDLGVVTSLFTSEKFAKMRQQASPSLDVEENKVGKILRLATSEERIVLPLKFEKEIPLLRSCQFFAEQMNLNLSIYGVEYQFDGKVLFIYYNSLDRVDYREFVQHVIRLCCPKTRVQMKKSSAGLGFVPKLYAACSLATGEYHVC